MAFFPSTPANNDTTLVNGITYQYNSSLTAWKIVPQSGVSVVDSVARSTANAAFAKANTAGGVKITSLSYPSGNTSANENGGETITVTGSGFNSDANVYVDTTVCSTTYANATSLSFTTPAKAIGSYHLFVYNNDGTFGIKPAGIKYTGPILVDYLAVAGGGGGGRYGGGGGAGGLLYANNITLTPSVTYTVTIGAGGTVGDTIAGTNGGNTSISGSGFTTVTTFGGGGGAGTNVSSAGGNGGSGGGGAGPAGTFMSGGKGVYPGSSYISQARQGYDGGDFNNVNNSYMPGGGGAGGAGQGIDGPSSGGIGFQTSITGTGTYYAGGGGGGGFTGQGLGGSGGGGKGGANEVTAIAGTVNTGGGGGGGGYSGGTQRAGGLGGSGVVIFRISSSFSATTTGSPTITTDGSYKIYKFTSSGSITL